MFFFQFGRSNKFVDYLKSLKDFTFFQTMKQLQTFFIYIAILTQCSVWSASLLVDEQGGISSELKALIELFPVEHDGSLSSLVAATQSHWMQKGRKRWEFTPIITSNTAHYLHCVKMLDCHDDILPEKKQYDYAILLGATVPRMRSRLVFLKRNWAQAVRFPKLVFLCSKRPIEPQADGSIALRTEEEAGMSLIQEILQEEVLNNIQLICISVPLENKDEKSVFPNTADTLASWLSSSPMPGSCLFISSQPFIHYQDAIVRSMLPKHFFFETVGPMSTLEVPASILLDTVAKWLYVESQQVQQ